jgi:hypothetical protein
MIRPTTTLSVSTSKSSSFRSPNGRLADARLSMSEDIGLKAWVRVSTDKLQNRALSDPHRCPAQGVQD